MAGNGPFDQQPDLGESLMDCQLSGEFCDLTLVCEGFEYNVHKVVVCSQVPALNAACTKGFQVRAVSSYYADGETPYNANRKTFKETFTGIYKFEEESHIIVEKLIEYLYQRSYTSSESDEEVNSLACPILTELQIHAQVFALADKYLIPGLKSLSAGRFKRRLRNKSGRSHLQSSVLEFLESIPEVFNGTPGQVTDLRKICLEYAYKTFPLCARHAWFREPYKKAISEAPQLAVGLLDQYLGYESSSD